MIERIRELEKEVDRLHKRVNKLFTLEQRLRTVENRLNKTDTMVKSNILGIRSVFRILKKHIIKRKLK